MYLRPTFFTRGVVVRLHPSLFPALIVFKVMRFVLVVILPTPDIGSLCCILVGTVLDPGFETSLPQKKK
jgi:hypothetical protein